MPNPFTKYTPTTYVPGYVPAPIEQYAKTIGALSQQHQQNIATKNSIDIMAANIDLLPVVEWVKEDAINGINSDLGDILENGRVQDASYLLPEVYKRRIGANKDLIWAEKQTKKVRQAEDLKMKYGSKAIDFNLTAAFNPIEIDPETGEKKYNEYNVDVEQRTDRLGDIEKSFNGAQLKGSTSGLKPVEDLPFYRYIKYIGLQPSQYDKFAAMAWETFKETDSYKQMMKERDRAATSPTGEHMDASDADLDVMATFYESGKRFLGSTATGYSAMPEWYAKGNDPDIPPFGGPGGAQKLPIGEKLTVKIPAQPKEIHVKRNGNIVQKGIRAEITASYPSGYTLPDISLKRLPLESDDMGWFAKMVEYQKEKNPEFTEDQAKDKAAELWNNGSTMSREVLYVPFPPDSTTITKLNDAGYLYNREKTGSSYGVLGTMSFYSPDGDGNRIAGQKLFKDKGYDIVRPVGTFDIENPENNPFNMNMPIVFEAGKLDTKNKITNPEYLVAEKDANYAANISSSVKSTMYAAYHKPGAPVRIKHTDERPIYAKLPMTGLTAVDAVAFSSEKDGVPTFELNIYHPKTGKLLKRYEAERYPYKNNKTGQDETLDPVIQVFSSFRNDYLK